MSIKINLHLFTMCYFFFLGRIPVNDWCDIVSNVLDLQLPWRTLKSRLVDTDSDGFVLYESSFRSKELQFTLNNPINMVRKRNDSILKKEKFYFIETTKSLSSHISK